MFESLPITYFQFSLTEQSDRFVSGVEKVLPVTLNVMFGFKGFMFILAAAVFHRRKESVCLLGPGWTPSS